MDYAVAKLRAVAPTVTAFPTGTKFEKYTTAADGSWVGGFWPGQLWMAYLYTNDDAFKQLAESWALKLAPRETQNTDHDLGFLFTPSWVTAYRLTGDTSWRDGALVAAGELIKRFNPKGQFIRAWGALGTPDNAGRMIIVHMTTRVRTIFDIVRLGEFLPILPTIADARAALLVPPTA